jgi:hypothetical protein
MVRLRLAAVVVLSLLGAACNLFDSSQVPAITVGTGLRPEIAWTPSPAYLLTMYAGDKDGDGIGALWSLSGGTGFENSLKSPVVYGVPPAGSEYSAAPALEAGKTYTVTVFRKDPKGQGDGFTGTGHRYVGVKTFTATE